MIPGTRRCLRQLSNDGARIRIITSRLQIRYFHNLAVTLDANRIPYWDLCFMKAKSRQPRPGFAQGRKARLTRPKTVDAAWVFLSFAKISPRSVDDCPCSGRKAKARLGIRYGSEIAQPTAWGCGPGAHDGRKGAQGGRRATLPSCCCSMAGRGAHPCRARGGYARRRTGAGRLYALRRRGTSRRPARHVTRRFSTTMVSTIDSRSYIQRLSHPAITAPTVGATQNSHSWLR